MKTTIIAAFAAVALAGCAAMGQQPQYKAQTFRNGLQAQQVALGTVVAVRSVTTTGSTAGGTEVGALAGALAGGLGFGGGSGKALTAAVGGLLGAGAGRFVASHLDKGKGEDVTVKETSGRLVAVVQSGPALRVGEAVQVVTTPPQVQGGRATVRVLPLLSAPSRPPAAAHRTAFRQAPLAGLTDLPIPTVD